MASDHDNRLVGIEQQLREIARDIGGIRQFMETSTKQTTELFRRQTNLELNGCANLPDHKELIKKVEEHEKVLNKAIGAMIATGAIGSFLGTIGGWFMSSWTTK